MDFIVAVSAFIIPLIIFYVVVYGIVNQTDVYDVFVEGAKDGMKNGCFYSSHISRFDDGSGNFEVVRLSYLDIIMDWKIYGTVWISFPDCTAGDCQNVQFISSNRAVTGFVQRIWNRFLHRTGYVYYDELYGNNIFIQCLSILWQQRYERQNWTLAGALLATSSRCGGKCNLSTINVLKLILTKYGGLWKNEKICSGIYWKRLF